MPSDACRANERAIAEHLAFLERPGRMSVGMFRWAATEEAREAAWLEWEQSYLAAVSLREGDLDGLKH